MKKQNNKLTDPAILRQKAEEQLSTSTSLTARLKSFSEAETLKLIHELEVHQIELEMQNEELLIAKEKAELAEEKYTDLYDFAPSGYLSLTKEGVISELNFVAAKILGKERSKLIKKRFDFYVSIETHIVFNYFFDKLFKSKEKQSCEVIIAIEGKLPIYITIEGIVSNDGELCLLTIVDITEKKLAEEALIKSQFELNHLSESIDAIIWRFDLKNDKWLYVSPQCEKMLGYAPHEWTNFKWWVDSIHPDDQTWATEFCINQTKFGNNHDFEYRLIHKNGNIVWVHDSVGVEMVGNEPAYIYGIMNDITERKLTDAKLKESEEFSRYLLQTIPFGMDIVDENGTVLFQNDKLKKLCGAKALGDKCWDYYRDDKKQCSGCPLRSGIKLGTTEMYETTGVMGGKVFEIIHTGMIFNGQKAMLEIFIDITEQKQMEDIHTFLITSGYPGAKVNFFESLAKYLSKMLNMEYVCIDKLDGDGLNAQTVAIYNDGKFDTNVSYTLKQTPCGEVVGKTICCFPEKVCSLFPNDAALQDLNAESYIGTTLWNSEGKPIGLIAIIGRKPLTNTIFAENVLKLVSIRAAGEMERKNIEDELINAKDCAEESDRLKSAFLANMSHEIRTPMNGILGFADLLKEPNLSGDEQQAYIDIIEKSGKRMLNIINDIIDISKIEAGLMKIEMQESNINEQIEYIYTFFKPEVEAKGIHLFFNTKLTANEALITTDREKLYAILINLVKNAIKYTPSGSIEFGYNLKKDNEFEIAELVEAKELEFYVKDTGIGVPKNRQQAIFERFVQADIDDEMARQGAGLGLAITKSYVEMLGGKIWVESEEGNGSCFYFTLPYQTKKDEKNIAEEQLSCVENKINNLKILIAEDDETSETLLSILLITYSKDILKVKNGIDAVEICRQNPDIDLIMMDIRMPVFGGYEATRQIRQFNKDVIIIAQTAFGLTGDREKALEAGCNDYISKPIKKNDLLDLIQKYFK
jgi:PAS domain S-box-containing protein